MRRYEKLRPLNDRGPLRVMFLITSMPLGGAETLLVNLVRRIDPKRFEPQICCLKEAGPLGTMISEELPVHTQLISHKLDVGVVNRLCRLFKEQQIDAVVTVGAGDKMFWGRLAARRAKLPVILCALHSTGWPDGIGKLNRMLTRITDGFIAVAAQHGKFLVDQENFPAEKVFVIPNGIDTDHFVKKEEYRQSVRREFEIDPAAKVITIVAALRPEKNHTLFLQTAHQVNRQIPDSKFLVVGDGPDRSLLEQLAIELELESSVIFAGSRTDIPAILSASDVFALTSKNEASPVSILEAMSCGLPVVAPNVGSISESLIDGRTGILFGISDGPSGIADLWLSLIKNDKLRKEMGVNARANVIDRGSLSAMTRGYESLLESIYSSKVPGSESFPVVGVDTSLSSLPTGQFNAS